MERPEVPEHRRDTVADHAPLRRWTGAHWVRNGVVLLIAGQLLVRMWVASQRGLYADDLQYGSQAITMDLFSSEFLFGDRGGHFMPGALLLTGVLSRLFPMEWGPVATVLVLLQLLASLSVLRMVRVLLGDRPAVLVPLAVYLFCPLSLGSYAWWAAAMNSVPLQIGLAWVVGDAVLLLRTGRRRHAVTGTVALLLTLLFYERAVLVPFMAFAVVAVLLHVRGSSTPLRAAWQQARELWIGVAVVLAAWGFAFVTAVPSEAVGSATVGQIATLTRIAAANLVPALAGGPWRWADLPGTPLAAAPAPMATASGLGLAVLVLWTAWRRRGAGLIWAAGAAYFFAGAVLVGLGRGAMIISDVLPMTFRYFAAEAVVFALVVAVLFVLPERAPAADPGRLRVLLRGVTGRPGRSTPVQVGRWLAVPVLTVAFVLSSLISTDTYLQAWSSDPTRTYLANARASLAAAGDSPLLDQNVPDEVMWGPFDPYNRASRVFLPLEDRPEFAEATDQLRMLDQTGRLRPAHVLPGVFVQQPPSGCWQMPSGGSADVPLDVAMFHWVWTAELHYTATMDGVVTVRMGVGEPVEVPVLRGSHTVYVRLVGDTDKLSFAAKTRGLGLCVRSGVVGNIEIG
jgi:hypothetical protein